MSNSTRSGFYKKMFSLAIPIALQQLLTSCAQLVDTAMTVGLGNVSTAAIGVAGRWGFLLNLALFGISSGTATMVAQFWGINDRRSIRHSYGIGLILSLAVGALYTVLVLAIPEQMMRVFTSEEEVIAAGVQYLQAVAPYGIFVAISLVTSTVMRSTEDVHTPLACSIASVATNTVLNYILIYGKLGFPALKLRGAAIATVIGMVVQAVLLFVIGNAKKNIIHAPIGEFFKKDIEFFKKFLRVCAPIMLNELLWGVGTNVYAMVYARQGSENYAAYTIFSSIEQIAFVFFVGICHACSIMTGKAVGAGKADEAYSMGKRFIKLVPLLGVLTGVAIIFLRHPLLGGGIREVLYVVANNTSSSTVLYAILGIFGGTLNAAAWVMLSWRKEGKLWVSLALTVILFMSFNTENLITNPYFWLFPVMALTERGLAYFRTKGGQSNGKDFAAQGAADSAGDRQGDQAGL